MSLSSLYRTSVGLARKRSRVSLAAVAAAAGVLGTVGATPWSHSTLSVTKTAHDGSQALSEQSGAFAFAPVVDVSPSAARARQRRFADMYAGSRNVSAADDHASLDRLVTLRKPGAGVISISAVASPSSLPHVVPQRRQASRKPVRHMRASRRSASHRPARHKRAKSRHHGAHATPAKPYRIYDSVHPSAIPAGRRAAVYANGAYYATAAQAARHKSVLWIDVNGSDPAANVLDVEPGDATPAGAARWVHVRLSRRPHAFAVVYTMRSEWGAVRQHVSHLPRWMRTRVRYWIADPTGVPHVVPGSSATQWYWGKKYDITTANPNFQR